MNLPLIQGQNAKITSTVLSVSLISADIRGTVSPGRSVITDYFYGTCPSFREWARQDTQWR